MLEIVSCARPRWRLTAPDLRRDHARVRSLLERFAHLSSGGERLNAMRVALDLFEVHSALEDQLYATGDMRAAYSEIAELAQRIEATDPASRLFLARGLELKHALEAYMAAEEGSEPMLVRDQLHLADYNRNLLHLRRTLVEEAQRMLRVH